ncbi:glycoside hydrolase family 16 protein [Hymenopellis radicata]|nr:glycoside hydrolase family 16 protein [Hymenopellis radicata]
MYNASRFSAAPSELSSITGADKTAFANSSTVPQYLWDKDPDLDDALHNPDPVRDAKLDRSFTLFSGRGWANASALVILVTGLITLFAGYPIIDYYARQRPASSGFNLGGINGSGQVPDLPGLPSLIDTDTPSSAYSRTGLDGKKYNLVFSDEFELDGRTFYPGEDPYWEAADIHYWPTGDLEWYDPSALTTKDGKLVITLSMEDIHDLNWKSGMLTSWNKLCFTTGYIEVSVSMPGRADAPGLWPGAWTMGNLGRAGYGATTEGMWPYSYDSCDTGTFPNQTTAQGEPAAALTGSDSGGEISFLPGQRLSACTCSGGDHPGPSTSTGRGVPEIDILEHQIDVSRWQGEVSQSYQVAPFNYQYQFDNTSSTIYDDTLTAYNTYKGGQYQQAVSAVTLIPTNLYNDQGYGAYGFEWYSNPDSRDEGFIEWVSDGVASWKITSTTIGSDSTVEIGPRLISEEPMYIILNLGLSPSFQQQDYMHLEFPSKMYIDYVRVYQRAGTKNGLTCNPPNRPTSTYINDHINAYSNANFTVWDAAGYEFPRNSLYDGC